MRRALILAVLAVGAVLAMSCQPGPAGPTTTTSSPPPPTGVIQVAAGGHHSCALRNNGTVKCWGENVRGQLGRGTTGGLDPTPAAVAGISGATSIAAGDSHTCVTLADETARCWGSNSYGELGAGSAVLSAATPVVPLLGGPVRSISADGVTTCAVRTDGLALCWGANTDGQLGIGSADEDPHPTPMPVPSITEVASIAVGLRHSCAALVDGTAKCWGYNLDGQIGNGTSGANVLSPAAVSGLTDVAALAVGQMHTCAQLADGTVACWGDKGIGQLGNGTAGGIATTPQAVPALDQVTTITAKNVTTCVTRQGGEATCWGYVYLGGQGSAPIGEFRPTPTAVVGLVDARSISAGDFHTCAVRTGGGVSCWGFNYTGQLGTGTAGDGSPTPVDVINLS